MVSGVYLQTYICKWLAWVTSCPLPLFLVSHRLPNLLPAVCDLTIPGRELKIYIASLIFSTVVNEI